MTSKLRFFSALTLAFLSAVSYAAEPESGTIEVSSQILKGESIIVSRVMSSAAGWVSIHLVEDNNPGRLLGFAPVRAGINSFVWIKLDLTSITPSLMAVLHTDAGKSGAFEHPGPDIPVVTDGMMVVAAFNLVGCRGEIYCDPPMLETIGTSSPWGPFAQ
jgi:hypothetical protein